MATTFSYSNESGRPTGPLVRTMGRVLPGVRAVQAQIAPYAAAWQRDNELATAADGPLWVALGDSMTQGIGASSHRRGYVGQLSDTLAEGWAHRVVNLSFNGARVQDVLDRQLPALEALTAEQGPAALVTVVIGSNDVFVRRHREHLVERFTLMLERLPPGSVVSNLPNPHGEAVQLDASLRERDRQGSVVLADMRSGGPGSWRGRLSTDFFHPNDLGYAGMAQVVGDAVRRVTGSDAPRPGPGPARPDATPRPARRVRRPAGSP